MACTQDKIWTTLELLTWTTDYFREAGLENPRLNAEVLLGSVLRMERIMLYARFEQPVGAPERARFRALVRRRVAREPLQYLVGGWEFYGRHFQLTPAVLIPRQETELVVGRCLELLDPEAPGTWAADVGTGSGAIAVTLAAERPRLDVVAVDTSAAALEVAARNADRHGVADRVHLREGDLAAPVNGALPGGRVGVDLLVSNPPYVPTDDIKGLQPEVRDHEPRQALDGGPDGLDIVRRLVPQAAETVKPGGWLVLELGPGQAEAVAGIAGRTGTFDMATVDTVSDPGGCRRVFSVRRRPG